MPNSNFVAAGRRRADALRLLLPLLISLLLACDLPRSIAAEPARAELAAPRRPTSPAEWRYWLRNMVVYHHFTPEEVEAACGLPRNELDDALTRYGVGPLAAPGRSRRAGLLVLPYPGGRHPRIGFLEGAIRPQRDAKFSVFTPWDERSYVVVDLPEALWSNLGLTYLAHTHIPTVFDKQGISLPPLEWARHADGSLENARRLPNGIDFGARVLPAADAVRMELTLTNGTAELLRDLRVQNCVMLKGAAGFAAQTNANKVFAKPYVACRNDEGTRWIITAWDPCDRVWGNAPVPCLHSDPRFPDCPPGESRRLRGWLSFYQGTNLQAELDRIERTGWRR
jgi:hypothetical protein